MQSITIRLAVAIPATSLVNVQMLRAVEGANASIVGRLDIIRVIAPMKRLSDHFRVNVESVVWLVIQLEIATRNQNKFAAIATPKASHIISMILIDVSNCQLSGHVAQDCTAPRTLNYADVQDLSPEVAWDILTRADREKDLDSFRSVRQFIIINRA